MAEEQMIRDLRADLGPIVDQLIDMVNTARKAFIHQRIQLLTQHNNQHDPLCREIGSAMLKMNDLAAKKSGVEREPYLRLHSILTHFRIMAETTGQLEETLRKQIKDGVLFSDKAISQISYIFDLQTEILSSLADVIRNGSKELRLHAVEECKKLSQSCLQFATDHETRLIEGLCFPQAAPLFLAILDQMQAIVHHDEEIALLLGE
ncbi:MAG: hypothetical protein PHH91_12015 [Desulfuromonadaceae bacterium]|nr:hypothetical protein [Desulfuromonadaceae bacterium]